MASSAAAVGGAERVTLGGGGAQASAGGTVGGVSPDGRLVSFSSVSPGLVAGDADTNQNVFLYDRATKATEAIDLSSTGARGNNFAQDGSQISSDGRYVLFESLSSNLVPGDTNGQGDVFLRDRQAGTTERVSVTTGGGQGLWASSGIAMSPDARFVAFSSDGMAAADANLLTDVYVRDRQTGVTELVSVSSSGVQPTTAGSFVYDISADGRFVLFATTSGELVPGDTNNVGDLFVRDRQLGTTERVSVSTMGAEGDADAGGSGALSADGRYVSFNSSATNMVSGDTNAASDIFVRDRQLGTTERVSVRSGGGQTTKVGYNHGMSDDGRIVAFVSQDSNVVSGDTNGTWDVFVHDRQTHLSERVSVGVGAAQPNGSSLSYFGNGALSPDGRFVLYWSEATNLVGADTNGALDGFLRDRGGAPVPIPLAQTIGNSCASSLGSTTDGACGDGGELDEDVDGENGGLSQSATDARLSGRGVTFSFSRSYSSVDTQVGKLGPGWTHPYQASLSFYLNGDIDVHAEDGQTALYLLQPDGSFATPQGLTATLAAVAGGFTLTALDRSRISFDSAGRLTQMLDETGYGLTFAYSGPDMTQITGADGKQIALTYDTATHLLTLLTLPDSRYVAYTYRPDGRLETVRDLRGGITTYTYDGLGRLDGVKDQLDHWAIRVVYDAQGRIVEKRDALDNRTTYAWDPATGTHTRTDPRGGIWREIYTGNVLEKTIDPLGNTVSYRYDERLNRVAVTDGRANAGLPNGGTTTMTYDAQGNRLTQTNALASSESWTYDAQNRPLTYTNARGHTTSYIYNVNGDLWKQTDAKGGVTEYTYTPERQIATVKDARGNTTTNTYDPTTKRLIRVATPAGNATVYEYDAFGRLSGQIDPRGQVSGADPNLYKTVYTYNDSDQQTSVRDPRGNLTTTAYDLAGREVSMTDAKGKITSYGYDAANRRTSVTDPNLGVARTEYDAAGNATAQVSPAGDRTTFVFDLAGRQTQMTMPRGNVTGGTPAEHTWTYVYDGNGNRSVVRDPLANETTTAYDELNRPVAVTDARGKTTTTAYDPNGNVVSVTNPMGHVSSSTYDELDRKVTETTPRGKVGSMVYDAVGNVVSETTPLGNKTAWAYDVDNRQVAMVEPRGNVTGGNPATYTWAYTYDPAGNRLTERSPLNQTTTWTYDGASNRTTQVDGLSHATTWAFDELNRLRAVTGPDAPTCSTGPECVGGKKSTVYDYDDAGNLTSRADPKAHATAYSYDPSRRLTQVLSPTSQKWSYGYDADGNQTQLVTARGNAGGTPATGTITKAYDRRGKLTNITFGDGITPNVAFAYDPAGRLQSMTDGAGTETYTLDDANRVTQITRGTESFSYQYDADSNVTRRTYPDTTFHTATFDNDGRLATIVSGGQTTSFTYDAAANLTRTTLPSGNGHLENRVYDAAGRITQVENKKGSTIGVRVTQTLDAVGNPTLIATTRGTTTTNQTFAYDPADRITRNCLDITTACTPSAAKRIEYTYDAIGNRLTQNRVGVTAPGSTTYTYNNADQLTQTVSGATTTFGYDADGNQTSAGAKTYSYDLANRLTQTVSGATTTTYTYDGQSRRLTRATNATLDTRYAWDTIGPLPELALERTNTNGLIRRYIHGPDGPLSLTTSAGTFYYHRDPIGSIRTVTSSTGAEQWRHDYDPFGENRLTTKVVTSAPANPVQYAGEHLDTETSQYHLRARQYDPATGRFTAVDPIAPRITDQYAATYIYAANRPNVLTDPTGEDPWARGCGPDGDYCTARFQNLAKWNPGRVCIEYSHHPNCAGGNPEVFWFLASFVGPEAIVAGIATKSLGLTAKGVKALRAWRAERAAAKTAKTGLTWGEKSGILQAAARGKGNFGLGSATAREADQLGKAWVGEGFRVAKSDSRVLISRDGRRVYRPPSYKGQRGRYQANLEERRPGQLKGKPLRNGHLDVTDLP